MPLIATYDARSHQKIQVCNKAEEDGIIVHIADLSILNVKHTQMDGHYVCKL